MALALVGALVGGARAQEDAAPAEQAPVVREERPRVVAIVVEGERRYTEAQLVSGLGLNVGEPIDYEQIDRGIETLWRVFHVRAQVSQRAAPGGVEVRLDVVELPSDLEPRFLGNDKVSTKKIHEWLGLSEGQEIYLYQAPRLRQRLIDAYQRDGFYWVDVREVVRDEGAGGVADVIFEIREGPRVRVDAVVVHGNDSMPATGFGFWKGGLKHLANVQLAGPTLLNWFGKKFDREVLEADLVAMRNVYRDRGWLDAVVELDRLEFNEERSRVTIHVVVDEGTPYSVRSLALEGVVRVPPQTRREEWREEPADLIFPEEVLRGELQLEPGKRYEQASVRADERALRDYYGERGYLSHPSLAGQDNWEFLEPQLLVDPETHQVDVTYRIAQGRQRFLREVLFAGGKHTRDRVMRRDVTVLPGELADLKKIRRSLASLQGTGFFSDERNPIEHREPDFRFKPSDDPDFVDLEYVVEEGRVVNFAIAGGIGSDNGFFGRVTLSFRNFDITSWPSSLSRVFGETYSKEAFHGAGQQLDIDIAPGTEVDFFRLHFLEPDLFRTHFQRYSLDVEASKYLRRYDNYDEDRTKLPELRVGRRFTPELSAFLGFTNQHLVVDNIEQPGFGEIVAPDTYLVPRTLQEEEGESDLIGLLFDVRWRSLDRFVNPVDGHRVLWQNQLFHDALGSDWQFVTSQLDVDLFFPIGSDEQDVRRSWHLGLEGGVAQPIGGDDFVPYSERFFAGGVKSMRGFGFRGVGPSLGSQPLGGESMLLGTLEYRIPLYSVTQRGTYKQVEMFRMQIFLDAGILDPEPFQLDPKELRLSTGVGFGLSYPIPLTFNFGFPLRKDEDDDRQTFSFSIEFY